MDLYYIFDSESEQYFNHFHDYTTRSKDWVGWRPDALEVGDSLVTPHLMEIKTRFTLQEIFAMEDKFNVSLMPYLLPYKEGDDKHLKI